jgi:hypothetical protein
MSGQFRESRSERNTTAILKISSPNRLLGRLLHSDRWWRRDSISDFADFAGFADFDGFADGGRKEPMVVERKWNSERIKPYTREARG